MEQLKSLKVLIIEEISNELVNERDISYLNALNSLLITVADLLSKKID